MKAICIDMECRILDNEKLTDTIVTPIIYIDNMMFYDNNSNYHRKKKTKLNFDKLFWWSGSSLATSAFEASKHRPGSKF